MSHLKSGTNRRFNLLNCYILYNNHLGLCLQERQTSAAQQAGPYCRCGILLPLWANADSVVTYRKHDKLTVRYRVASLRQVFRQRGSQN